MATQWISPTWRMPEVSNQSKVDNYSLEFDGASDFIDAVVDLGVDSSITMWFKPATSSYALLGEASSGYDYLISRQVNNFYVWMGSSLSNLMNFGAAITNNILNDEWNFLAIEKTGDTVIVYLKNRTGEFSSTVTNAGVAALSLKFDRIGTRTLATPTSYYEGEIGQIAGFDYALTPAQITALYNSGTPVNPMALTPAPVAYYPLGGSSTGDAAVVTSPNTLTVPNESVPSATVFDFDGTDIILADPTFATGPINSIDGAISISSWFKTTASGDTLVGRTRTTSAAFSFPWVLYTDNSNVGKLAWALNNTNGDVLEIRLTGTTDPQGDPLILINDGSFHNVVATYDGSNTSALYIDGVLQKTVTVADFGNYPIPTAYPAGRTCIGGTQNSSGGWPNGAQPSFVGEVSNVQIWNTKIESSEVSTLYNNGVPYTSTQPQAANLKGWYKLNVDTSTWDGSDWIIGDNSVDYKTSLNFNGDSYIAISPNTFDATNGLTMSCWVRYDASAVTGLNWLCSNGNTGGVNSQFNTRLEAGGAWFNYFVGGSSYTGINGLGDGQWHHIAQTVNYSTGDVMYYKDGVPSSTVSTWGSSYATAILATISTSFYPFGGNISNFAIFSSALSTPNIVTLYNNGYPEVTPSFSPTSWWKLDNLTTGIQDSGSASNNGTNNGASTSNIPVSPVNGTSDGMTTANLVNSDLTRSIPYSSYSMTFDGTDQYIDITNTDLGLNNTTSIWFKRPATGTHTLLGSGSGGSWNNYTVQLQSTGKIRYANEDINYVEFDNATTQSIINTTDTWINIIIIRNGADANLYVNSIDYDGVKTFSSGTTVSTVINTIGAAGGSSGGEKIFEFAGSLSNCSIYNSTLTQDQVFTIYNGGVPNSISSLSPVGWWSLAGDSYYNGSDFICPDLGSGSNNGTSSGMGGTELVGDGPGSTANGVATSMNIPGNLKGNAPNSSKNAFSVNMNSADRVEDVAPTP